MQVSAVITETWCHCELPFCGLRGLVTGDEFCLPQAHGIEAYVIGIAGELVDEILDALLRWD